MRGERIPKESIVFFVTLSVEAFDISQTNRIESRKKSFCDVTFVRV